MIIEITRPDIEALINRRLQSGSFKDAEEVILDALLVSDEYRFADKEKRRDAIERLKVFGKIHNLSLNGMTIRQLRTGDGCVADGIPPAISRD
ncbi:MAG: hypothetical protein WB676_25705 [Bryobacteraceae bacterium]